MEKQDSFRKDALLMLFFGLYLSAGAFFAALKGSWPIFLPPQVDIIELLLGAFGHPLGAYLGSAVLLLLGGLFTWLGGAGLLRSKPATEGQT